MGQPVTLESFLCGCGFPRQRWRVAQIVSYAAHLAFYLSDASQHGRNQYQNTHAANSARVG